MELNPVQSLVLLLLLAVGVSGWMYGLHWKGVASGGAFTQDERTMIRLQDQIGILTRRNEELNAELSRLVDGEEVAEDVTGENVPAKGGESPGSGLLPPDGGAGESAILPEP